MYSDCRKRSDINLDGIKHATPRAKNLQGFWLERLSLLLRNRELLLWRYVFSARTPPKDAIPKHPIRESSGPINSGLHFSLLNHLHLDLLGLCLVHSALTARKFTLGFFSDWSRRFMLLIGSRDQDFNSNAASKQTLRVTEDRRLNLVSRHKRLHGQPCEELRAQMDPCCRSRLDRDSSEELWSFC